MLAGVANDLLALDADRVVVGDAAMTHPNLTPMQRERNERDRRYLRRKITDPATNRMRERTAREQLAAAQADMERGPEDVVPDDADYSSWSNKF